MAQTPDKIDELSINTIRTLSMDAVQKAKSGHPGTPMALAPIGYVLFHRHLRHNPANPDPSREVTFGEQTFVADTPGIRELGLYDMTGNLREKEFIKQTFEGSVTERVMTAIEQSAHTLTLEQLAQRWHMSRRTLHRQLQREGTSFRRLSEQLRRDRAVALLLEGRCQVREIAHQLDMTEPAFSRAFKQWTGMTPLAYRKLRIPPGGGRKPAQ